jgi:hypothetical protein
MYALSVPVAPGIESIARQGHCESMVPFAGGEDADPSDHRCGLRRPIPSRFRFFILQPAVETGISLTGYQAGESLQEKLFDANTAAAVNDGVCASTKAGEHS